MSLSCAQALGRLHDYAAEALDSGERRALRDHLAACGDCRESAIHADPGLLFAGSAAPETSDEDVARILAGVRAGIAWRQAERKLGNRPVRRSPGKGGHARRRLAAMAAAVVALSLLVPASTLRRGEPRTASTLAAPRVRAEGPVVPAARPAASEVPTSKFPTDATIYDWSSGAGEPRVVWIVDRSLDI
jgi:hypothetical protein